MKRPELVKHHDQSIDELKVEVGKIEAQLVEASMKMKMGQLKNVRQPKTMRHDIARLKTIIRIKELAETVAQTVKSGELSA